MYKWKFKRSYEYHPKRKNDESQLQIKLVRWLDSHNIHYVASLMGVNLGTRVGAIRKKMGCRSGVHDIIILQPSGNFNGMTLELKIKGGHITPEQKAFQATSIKNGYHSVIMPPDMDVQDALDYAIGEIYGYLNIKKEELWIRG